MRWCVMSCDKKGFFVNWDWCDSFWNEDFDYGESYDLDMPLDWWAKSWKDAKEDFDNCEKVVLIPFFLAYLFMGIQTIIAVIKRKRQRDPAEAEFDFFASHYWDDDINDWVEKGGIV